MLLRRESMLVLVIEVNLALRVTGRDDQAPSGRPVPYQYQIRGTREDGQKDLQSVMCAARLFACVQSCRETIVSYRPCSKHQWG